MTNRSGVWSRPTLVPMQSAAFAENGLNPSTNESVTINGTSPQG